MKNLLAKIGELAKKLKDSLNTGARNFKENKSQMAAKTQIRKNLNEKERKNVLMNIKDTVKTEHGTIIPFEKMPMNFLKFFIGKIKNKDVTGIAAFTIINKFPIKIIETIIRALNQKKKNHINESTFGNIERKIKHLNNKTTEHQKELEDWKMERQKAIKERTTIPVKPKTPDYHSFSLEKEALLNIMGQRYVENLGTKIQEIKQAGNKTNPKNIVNQIDFQMDELQEAGSLQIRILDGELNIKMITIKPKELSDITITID